MTRECPVLHWRRLIQQRNDLHLAALAAANRNEFDNYATRRWLVRRRVPLEATMPAAATSDELLEAIHS